ncbi:MAG: RtcB family protein [Acidimicrobiia bacterium]|nr:RtcB family protein [Acidimicrobiia bacterium]
MTATALGLEAVGPAQWRIAPTGAMRVPGVVFASAELFPAIEGDQSLRQVADVASLPGVVEASYAMPDMHWGYGFPIGGVAATDVEAGGVVSPGGVGFDISCGVRVLVSDLERGDVSPRLGRIMDRLAEVVPCGLGRGGVWGARSDEDLDEILVRGAEAAVEAGFGDAADLTHCEDGGRLAGAAPDHVSARARERGRGQVGSLGSGNHFLEVQVVDRVFDTARAEAFGLTPDRVCVMIHTGSRGLGHQVCADHVHVMERSMGRYGIAVPDRQLACAPVRSPEGEAYMGAMTAAANYGRVNRQLLTHASRRAFEAVCGRVDLRLLYDVSHNLAKLEDHVVSGSRRLLCVHRKGATRALPPGHAELPAALRGWGQPVLVPGSMGTASYVLSGIEGGPAFNSCCHGAGRTMSRHAAKRQVRGDELARRLEAGGIRVRAHSMRGLAEEAPFAYKDVDAVVAACEEAGLAHVVARVTPLGVVKG